jgi:hypothetical protein
MTPLRRAVAAVDAVRAVGLFGGTYVTFAVGWAAFSSTLPATGETDE